MKKRMHVKKQKTELLSSVIASILVITVAITLTVTITKRKYALWMEAHPSSNIWEFMFLSR
jgi:hypothetical protein